MAISYFGYCNADGSNKAASSGSLGATAWVRNRSYVTNFTCPGSGNQTVKELSAYLAKGSGACNVRLAIYTTANARVCQGSAEVAVTGSANWYGHKAGDGSDITPNPATLTGGTTYRIAYTVDGTTVVYYYDSTGSANQFTYTTTDYTGGFPDPLADGSDPSQMMAMRCGVEAAAVSGTPIPIIVDLNMKQRNN